MSADLEHAAASLTNGRGLPIVVSITTLEPEPYDLATPISAVIEEAKGV